MADIRQPDELVLLTGNIAENWRKFRQEFELYMIASGHDGKPEKQKVALLLHVARKQAIDVFNTFALTEEQKADYDVVVQRFEIYCSPKTNETYERYMFNSRKQFQGEAVEQFVTELKIRAQSCNFGDLRDSMIRDRLVLGITSQRVRERLLREEDLTLGKAVQICQAAEISERQIQTIAATVDGDASINYCTTRGRHQQRKPTQTPTKMKCSCCDTFHAPRACPAYGKPCNKCGKRDILPVCAEQKQREGKFAMWHTASLQNIQTSCL